jgi:hypothetical protein
MATASVRLEQYLARARAHAHRGTIEDDCESICSAVTDDTEALCDISFPNPRDIAAILYREQAGRRNTTPHRTHSSNIQTPPSAYLNSISPARAANELHQSPRPSARQAERASGDERHPPYPRSMAPSPAPIQAPAAGKSAPHVAVSSPAGLRASPNSSPSRIVGAFDRHVSDAYTSAQPHIYIAPPRAFDESIRVSDRGNYSALSPPAAPESGHYSFDGSIVRLHHLLSQLQQRDPENPDSHTR